MKVRIGLISQYPGNHRRIEWPVDTLGNGAVPRIGEVITDADGGTWEVTVVNWHPEGDATSTEPFVYVVAQ